MASLAVCLSCCGVASFSPGRDFSIGVPSSLRCQSQTALYRPTLWWDTTAAVNSPFSRPIRAEVQVDGTAAVATEEQGKPQGEATLGGCPGCGKLEKVGGCNGEGRIQGGIGAVPGFGWWPIKAFRPCPAFVEAGGRYRRKGQSLEEVAFGREAPGDDLDISERFKG